MAAGWYVGVQGAKAGATCVGMAQEVRRHGPVTLRPHRTAASATCWSSGVWIHGVKV